jgi:hypothetical protein
MILESMETLYSLNQAEMSFKIHFRIQMLEDPLLLLLF